MIESLKTAGVSLCRFKDGSDKVSVFNHSCTFF